MMVEKKLFASPLLLLTYVLLSSCNKSSPPSSTSGGTPVKTITSTSTNTGISPPDISYTYPQYFTAGTAINSLTPINTGTAVPAGNYGGTKIIASNLNGPEGLVFDQSGNLFVTESGNDDIKEIAPGGVVSTFVVKDTLDYLPGFGSSHSPSLPDGIAIDQSGNLYNCNSNTGLIKKITSGGVVTTLAGAYPAPIPYVNGIGLGASFEGPMGIAIDQTGNLFVADQGNHAIRKITPEGLVSTFATGLFYPTAVALDPTGNLSCE